MKQTPVHEKHNPDLLKLIPIQSKKIIEVGCSSGALAREFKKISSNPEELANLNISQVPVGALSASFVRNLVKNNMRDKFNEKVLNIVLKQIVNDDFKW
jgi:hypothetical protein